MVKATIESSRSSSRLASLGVIKAGPVEKKSAAPKKAPAAEKKAEMAIETAEKKEKEVKEVKETKETKATGSKWTIGGQITAITLSDQDGNDVDLTEVAKDNGFIVFFYPAANTPGCTNQALCYKDEHAHFVKKGFKVFGCSKDGAKSQTTFKTKHSFPYQLLCDPKKELIAAIGAKNGDKTTRSHVVVAKGGKVLDIVLQVPAKESAKKALDLITNA